MAKQRILYIDLLKGLSITWVVWFHTIHPAFVDYSFRMPLFFLASAIFFKPYPVREFAEKKLYQMIIPFVVFYLIYYGFMIVTSAISSGNFNDFNYSCIWDVFKRYNMNGGPSVNPPLWFIMALLNLQILLYVCVKLIRKRIILMILSFAISVYALLYLFEVYTYFQFGRALRYFCYYVFGYLYGRDIIKIIEGGQRDSKVLFAVCAGVFIVALGIKQIFVSKVCHEVVDYFQITALVILLIYLFRYAQNWWIMKPLKYYGANSYIVLGMNEMILSTLLVAFLHVFHHIDIWIGGVHWVLTMILLIPVIKFLNKYIPWLVGKQNVFDTFLRRYKIACPK